MQYTKLWPVAIALLTTSWPAFANDSFAEVGAGGIRFLKQADISMDEEHLTISREAVDVAYVFRNSTDRDITIDVAFPVPPYGGGAGDIDFHDFSVTADGARVKVKRDTRAFAKDRELTAELRALGVPISDFDRLDGLLLPPSAWDHLIAIGAVEKRPWVGFVPLWTVKTTYYWRQKFPARALTRIRHQYTPSLGGDYFGYDPEEHEWNIDPDHLPECEARWRGDWPSARSRLDEIFFREWVRYILTTANNWNGPIRQFELTILRKPGESVMVCGDLEKLEFSADAVRASARSYQPTQDLVVAFLYQEP